MERLTINEIIEHCDRNTRMYEKACDVKYLETSTMNNSIKGYWEHKQVAEYLRKLKEYEDLEEQGRLLKLPCKVGDTVYCIENKEIYTCTVGIISISKNNGVWVEINFPKEMPDIVAIEYNLDDIGKTVFLTKSEAEAKLKELRGEENE